MKAWHTPYTIERYFLNFMSCPPCSAMITQSNTLPIHKYKLHILHLIETTSVVIVVGPTGSGKTTQIPQFLLEQGWTGLVCTQPRRLSAIAMATRVNQELTGGRSDLGDLIGYSVRFESRTSDRTLCRFITDGMLFRECLQDPLLSKYSVIMIDEAHERTLHTDLLLGLLKKILQRRPDLRIIVSSATIEAESFKKFFTLPKTDLTTGKRIYGPVKDLQSTEQLGIEDEKSASLTGIEDENDNSSKELTNNVIQDLSKFLPINRFEPQIFFIEGRVFPVKVEHLHSYPPKMIRNDQVIVDAVVRLVERINCEEGPGDVLVFLAGRSEIEQCSAALEQSQHNNNAKRKKEEPLEESEQLMSLFRRGATRKKTSEFEEKGQVCTLNILQLYAGMTAEDQAKVFEPSSSCGRKVILSTNIAEASVTIDGVVFVIDSGRMKVRVYEGRNEESLLTVPISKASADQRAGRAGRTCPGRVFRLYSQEFYQTALPSHIVPDAQLCSLTATVLQLKAMRIVNVCDFDFLTPLPPKRLSLAHSELFLLGALKDGDQFRSELTPFGLQMARLPLDPELAHFFIKACEMKCPREGAALAAMLTIQDEFDSNDGLSVFFNSGASSNILRLQRRLWMEEGDPLTLLSIFMSYLANSDSSVKFCQKYGLNLRNLLATHRLFSTLLKYQKALKIIEPQQQFSNLSDKEQISINIRKCLISAYPLNVAKSDQRTATFTSLTAPDTDTLNIHPNSVLFRRLPPLILYRKVIQSTKKFVKGVSLIEPEWLQEIHPNLYKWKH